jgi:hypothetical protein
MQITNELVSAAIADAGCPIDDPVRIHMENLFGINLQYVRLHRSEASLAANHALGSLAFAVDGHICMRPDFDANVGPMYRKVLAHELVHVLQKELGKNRRQSSMTANCDKFEAEADEVADQILSGRAISSLTPDPSLEPRCWGPAGHYWTVYYASMMAGLPKQDAMDNAFYAQMPDQVDELDATDEGEGYLPNYIGFVIPGDGAANRMLRRRAVQMGLHALSGWAAESETTYRKNILKTLDAGTFEFGLALHPFGDSFAHRIVGGGARMYSGPAGHAVEAHPKDCLKVVSAGGMKAACFENAYAVDNVSRRADLYVRYGLEMYDLILSKWGTRPAVDREKVEGHLGEITDEPTERDQVLKILKITAGTRMEEHGPYDPNNEPCAPWKIFHRNHPWLSPTLLSNALWWAQQWSGSY